MLSNMNKWKRLEVLFILALSVLSLLWYSGAQFRESIYFSLQLIRFFIPNFPDFFP